jgi:gluconate 2-dehydrogenase alpha chain
MSNLWFSKAQADIAAAMFERMFPRDTDPGAREIGVVQFVDRALAGIDADKQPVYRRGLQALEDEARARFATPFVDCTDDQQDVILQALEQSTLRVMEVGEQQELFSIFLQHLREGLFCDPVHGGNRDFRGWRFLGHPGAWLDYTAEECLGLEPADKGGEMRGVRDIPEPPVARAAPPVVRPAWGRSDDQCVDVILVGVGLVGGLVAPVLARGGLKVVGLEAGPWRQRGSCVPDELSYSFALRAGLSTKFQAERPTWRPDAGSPEVPAVASLGNMVNGVGGSALHYGAMLRRWHPHHFAHRTRAEALGGPTAIPDGCTFVDWPFGYRDIESYYESAEEIAGVGGEDGNPFVPRRKPFPLGPHRPFRMGESFRRVAADLGLHPYTCPIGINSTPYRGRPAARYNQWEVNCGDSSGAKWNPGLDAVPEALGTGNFDLRTNCRVTRVLTDDTGAACGVEYIAADGQRRTQRARCVVLAAYSLESIRLMFLSADAAHPAGLGNNTDQLGRHFMSRSFGSVYGHIPGERFNLHAGACWQNVLLEDFQAEAFDSTSHGFLGGATLGTEQGALPISVSRTALPPDVPPWGAAYKEHLRHWQEYAFIRIQPDALPYGEHRVELHPELNECTGHGLPILRITHRLRDNEERQYRFMVERSEEILRGMGATRTWAGPSYTGVLSSHDLGGCRMGHEPNSSVVDEHLEVHDTPGLFVFSGATFPTSCGINPTLTLMAVCLRASEHLLGRLCESSGVRSAGRATQSETHPVPQSA